MAQEALRNRMPNRKIREALVNKYARAMKEGRWRQNVAPLVFNDKNELMDGEHRLSAQVQSKTTQYWYVMRNAPEEYRGTIDVGAPRSIADELKLLGYQNSTYLGSVARWCYLLERGEAGTARFHVSNDEMLDMVDRHKDVEHSMEMGLYARSAPGKPDATPMGAAHWWIAQTNGHAEADMFIGRYVNNVEPPGSPLRALNNRLTRAKVDHESYGVEIYIAAIIKCWNQDVGKKYVQRTALRSKTGEYILEEVKVRESSQEEDVVYEMPQLPVIEDDEGDE